MMTKTTVTLADQFYAARRTGTPLVAVATADPAATILALSEGGALRTLAEGAGREHALTFRWDAQAGLAPIGKHAAAALAEVLGDLDLEAATLAFTGMLHVVRRMPADSVVFALNAHRLLGSDGDLAAVQGVWNLRDLFKQDFRMLALLGPQFTLPEELVQDVVTLADALPDEARLAEIVRERVAEVGLPEPAAADVERAVLATRGLAAFAAEQVVALSLGRDSLDVEALWERKKATIDQVPGLSVLRGGETYDDVLDLDGVVEFCRRVQAGPDAPAVIVQLEEFEKAMAGSQTEGGDNTGISQDRLAVILDAMEENDWTGLIAYGVPGAGKSLLIKAFANSAGALPVKLDLGAVLDKHVGVSEARIRRVMQTLMAAGGRSRVLFAASCNKIVTLPPELKRRFRMVVWFFDLPSAEGLARMWALQLRKHGLPADAPLPECRDWTGADVRNACDIARRLRVTPREAARYVVPVSKSDPAAVAQARQLAEGRLLSAAHGGVYVAPIRENGGRGVKLS